MIIIHLNFLSDSRTFLPPGPGASLQIMEAKVLAWAWANTLGNLVGNVGGGGQGRWRDGFGLGDRGTSLSEMSLKMIMLTEICVNTATITCCNPSGDLQGTYLGYLNASNYADKV